MKEMERDPQIINEKLFYSLLENIRLCSFFFFFPDWTSGGKNRIGVTVTFSL